MISPWNKKAKLSQVQQCLLVWLSDMPESYATAEIETKETTTQETKPRKMFRKKLSGKPTLQRQTSQMCSVM